MNETERAVAVEARIVRCLVRALGMMSENLNRARRDEAIAYPASAFDDLIDEECVGENSVLHALRDVMTAQAAGGF
jgi:hypothetical protein